MNIGYACLTIGVPNTSMKSCVLKNANDEKLARLIEHNLSSLSSIIDYNLKSGIRLFRISSDIIPFGSNSANTLNWQNLYKEDLAMIGEKIKNAGIRVSMHPGQYTVLNSQDKQVVQRAVEDLTYHAEFLDSLGVDFTNKIILHIGGVYGDKEAAMLRFAEQYEKLSESIKQRLVIENDDKSYHISDVLAIGARLCIPVVYDNLHNKLNNCDEFKNDCYWVSRCKSSWQAKDGNQKIHYSQQDPLKNPGSHSQTINIDEFLNFTKELGENEPDIMLEVKDKNLSAVKCINCSVLTGNIKALELEWSRYKYAILEKSPNGYKAIRELLKDKTAYPAIAFYNIIDLASKQEDVKGNCINAALHIWGYFKRLASEADKKRFFDLMQNYQNVSLTTAPLKRHLLRMATKYNQEYLISSYYFRDVEKNV